MLEGAGDAGARDLSLRPAAQVLAEKADPALVHRQRAADQVEHRRLAGAVGSDETQDFPGFELEAYAVDGHQTAKAACRTGDAQDRQAAFGLGPTFQRTGRGREGGL